MKAAGGNRYSHTHGRLHLPRVKSGPRGEDARYPTTVLLQFITGSGDVAKALLQFIQSRSGIVACLAH